MVAYKLDSRTLTSKNGAKVFAEAIGDPSKPSVVFCHGMCGDGSMFDVIFNRPDIQASIYAVRYDTRAHGRSEKPETSEGFETERYVEDFEAVVESFGLVKPFFAAWSLAGTIATDLCAAKTPISGIIYFAALPYIGEIMSAVCTDLVLGFCRGLMSDDATVALKTRIEFCRTLVAPERLASVPWRDFAAWVGGACQFTPKACQLNLSRKQDPAGLFEAGQNGLPLLVIGGKKDLQVNPQAVIESMSTHFKVCESLLLEDVGHMPFYEEPDIVSKRILEFVERYSPA